jgi:hypothetical protein
MSSAVKEKFVHDVAHATTYSLFEYQAAALWLSVAGMNAVFINEKIEKARFIVGCAASPGAVSVYVGMLLVGGDFEEARRFLGEIQRRSPKLASAAIEQLRRMQFKSLDLRKALELHPEVIVI